MMSTQSQLTKMEFNSSCFVNACKSFFHRIKETIKQFTKPATAVLAAGAASDITRSRKDLVEVIDILAKVCLVYSWKNSIIF
jgi:hypothetical protein